MLLNKPNLIMNHNFQYKKECLSVDFLPMAQETWVQFQVVVPKTQKMVLDIFLLNTQYCKVEQSMEKSSILSYTLV